MCNPWAYNEFQKYAAVFPEIVDILEASGVKARVKPTKDKAGFVVRVTLPAAVLSEELGDNWSVRLDGEVIDLGIPVENRDAKAIASALLKGIGK